MDLELKGKRALVTGASAGLGAAAAMALAGEGVVVAINSRSRERLGTTAEKIAAETGHAPAIVVGDVSSDDDVRRIVEEAGPVDILVSNAGGPPPGQFLDLPRDQWRAASDLVLFSAGLGAAVMVHQLWAEFAGQATLWDIGAVLDPYCGVFSRKNYRTLEWQESVMPLNLEGL